VILERIPDQFEHEPGFLRYLDAQGLRPGVSFRLVERRHDKVEIEIGGARRPIRPDCAVKVWVRRA
jgi:hypothetical protein